MNEQGFALGILLLALCGFGAAEIRDRWRDWRAARCSKHKKPVKK